MIFVVLNLQNFFYKSSMFEGILHGITLQNGINLNKSDIIDICNILKITASSQYNNDDNPYNVLKNDNSGWCSWFDRKTILKPNEWIQFEFLNANVSINAYAFKVGLSPKSWKIEGSNDNNVFSIIHMKTLNEDFKEAVTADDWEDPRNDKLYQLDKMSQMFRYIRITQGDDGNWNWLDDPKYMHIFSFYRIELFGCYQKQ